MSGIAATRIHDCISGNDVTRFRKDLGLTSRGLPACNSTVYVKAEPVYITVKEKQPDPAKPKKTIWVSTTKLLHNKYTSFGHSSPVAVTNPEYMQPNVCYAAKVVKVGPITALHPTLTLDVIY